MSVGRPQCCSLWMRGALHSDCTCLLSKAAGTAEAGTTSLMPPFSLNTRCRRLDPELPPDEIPSFSGMNSEAAYYSPCISVQFPYTLTSLHLTTSTAIEAVDDNQTH